MKAARLHIAAPLLAAALLGPACSGKFFRPETPRAAIDPDVRVNVGGLYVTKFPGGELDDRAGVRLSLDVERAPDARLGQARLTSTRLAPCASGLPAKETASIAGGAPGWETNVLAFSRPDAEAAGFLTDGSAALDLAVFPGNRAEHGHCVRIPLFAAGESGGWTHHALLFGGEERLLFLHSALSPLKSPALVLGLGMGAWAGRWRWMLEGEGGFADRDDPAAPPGANSTALYGLYGGGLSVDTLVYSHGHFGLGVLGGYEILRAKPGSGTSGAVLPPALTLNGPRVGLRLLYLVDPVRWPGFRSPLDAFVGGLTVYAGDWWNGIDVRTSSPFVGAAFEGNVGF